ncbi:MAG: 2-dehydro-3-deoxygalactonokinase [Clostridia bacterium]|nr:2-dehydro-3-deoxygalactonokinase [Clostridia bacterium]
MSIYITVDGGTTNTRVTLVRDREVIDTVRIPLGARACIDDKAALPRALRAAICDLLTRHALCEADVVRVLASGMITSEFGLCALPHLVAPAGLRELHEGMHEVVLDEITTIPFVFIRGVKTVGTLDDTDMMRGEETELCGLIGDATVDTLYVLPGSHSKLIETDAEGRITHFATMLTGEMLAALSSGTILKDAVDLSLREFDAESLTDGCRYAMDKGINEALFKVRILKNLFRKTPVEVYSFFLGAVLASEIAAIVTSPIRHVVIGGKAQIKRATEALLRTLSDKKITVVSDRDVDASSALGAIRIYEFQT